MEKNGQLTFSDDPFLLGCNTAYQMMEEGNFSDAAEKIDELMGVNPDYPGLVDIYRTSRFWRIRKDEMKNIEKGKATADFLMNEWDAFTRYSSEKNMLNTTAYKSAMKYIFNKASENYSIAFNYEQSTLDNFDLLLNLGVCFITLGDFKRAAETLEYARSTYRSNAKLLSLLGESYFHINEIPKSLVFFREAFFIDPSGIDLSLLNSKPIADLARIARERKPGRDEREWIPVFGYIEDVFYVKRQINTDMFESIKREIYTLEKNLQQMSSDTVESGNIIPRLINKYLWMLDYFELQSYDFANIADIRSHLIKMDKAIFGEFFKKKGND
jgi:tetratricopeptide (TPR) repeat protein